MSDTGYLLAEAAADLEEAGLYTGCLVAGPGGSLAPGKAPDDFAFSGAGLDSRSLPSGALFVALPGEHVHGRDFAGQVLADGHWVLAGGSAAETDPMNGEPAAPGAGVILSRDPAGALRTLAAAWRRRLELPVAAVTGTNGKTTTKDLLAALLGGAGPVHATAGNYNNDLGVPLTLLGLKPSHRFAVIELGASAEGEIGPLAALARPRVGVITNASPAHLDAFGSLEGIIRGKGELLDHLPDDGCAVLNADSPGFDAWRRRAGCPVVSIGVDSGDVRWNWHPTGPDDAPFIELDDVRWTCPLPGRHNGANLVAAISAARALGADDEQMRAGLATFRGSPHRGVVLEIGGRTVLDDSYNANPVSVRSAVATLVAMGGSGRAVAVLGHMAELGPDSADRHLELGRELAAAGLAALVAVGPEARPVREGFDAEGGTGHYCADREQAARLLAHTTTPGDRLLIKGSRSAGMEELLPLLADVFETS